VQCPVVALAAVFALAGRLPQTPESDTPGLVLADFARRAAELCDEPGIAPCTGKRFTPDTCDVDHVVAAKEAWESGAWAWPAQRRKAFGADRANPAATLACANRSKADGDTAEWSGTVASAPCDELAITPRGRCWWAAATAPAKTTWGLTANPEKNTALAAAC